MQCRGSSFQSRSFKPNIAGQSQPPATMTVICLGPCCIPVSAIFPVLFLLLAPFLNLVKKTPLGEHDDSSPRSSLPLFLCSCRPVLLEQVHSTCRCSAKNSVQYVRVSPRKLVASTTIAANAATRLHPRPSSVIGPPGVQTSGTYISGFDR